MLGGDLTCKACLHFVSDVDLRGQACVVPATTLGQAATVLRSSMPFTCLLDEQAVQAAAA